MATSTRRSVAYAGSALGGRYRRAVQPDWRGEGKDPDYRFSLANERTFLAWVRTCLALLACSVGVVQLATDLGTGWVRRMVGALLAATGVTVGGLAYRHWKANEQAMRTQQPLPHTPVLALLASVMTVVAVAVFLLVLLG
jgi:putative membrane protein